MDPGLTTDFTERDVDRLTRLRQFGLAGCQEEPGSADADQVARAFADLHAGLVTLTERRIIREGRVQDAGPTPRRRS